METKIQNYQSSKNVEIIHFDRKNPTHKEAFRNLNLEWIKKYFEVEEIDLKILSDPEGYILDKNGYILLAQADNKIIGTIALISMDAYNYELSKLCVTEEYQRYKVGSKLMTEVIELGKKIKAPKIYLITNSGLKAAISLYYKFGFIDDDIHLTSLYKRGDVGMALNLDPQKLP